MARRIARSATPRGIPTPDSQVRTIAARTSRESGEAAAGSEAAATRASPTHAQVAARAYEIYLARGGEDGRAEDDWLQAERELRGER